MAAPFSTVFTSDAVRHLIETPNLPEELLQRLESLQLGGPGFRRRPSGVDTAIVGSLVSLAAFTRGGDPYAVAYLGGGMAAVMWVSAVYLLSDASRITVRAMREPGAV